ncbi:hypothetical protein, partial [Escherichia coli]|uniref:hypothetical protein n=1 Tax=Escherichia coli TaxID=562 RepID=UPI002A3701F8
AEFETLELSTASQEQQDRVEQLNSDYQTACDTYGETSDQARALKYDLDEATATIEQQSFSVSDLYSEIDTLHTSTSELLDSYSSITDEAEKQ